MTDVKNEQLMTAVHYAVGKMCEDIGKEKHKTFTKQVIASIADLTYQQCLLFAKDLEAFAKHAKRKTINVDDVLLLVRRNEKLEEFVRTQCQEIKVSKPSTKSKPAADELFDIEDDFV